MLLDLAALRAETLGLCGRRPAAAGVRLPGRETEGIEWEWIRLGGRVFNGPGPLNVFWAKRNTTAGFAWPVVTRLDVMQ